MPKTTSTTVPCPLREIADAYNNGLTTNQEFHNKLLSLIIDLNPEELDQLSLLFTQDLRND